MDDHLTASLTHLKLLAVTMRCRNLVWYCDNTKGHISISIRELVLALGFFLLRAPSFRRCLSEVILSGAL